MNENNVVKISGEITLQSEMEMHGLGNLKEASFSILNNSGHHWNKHLISILRRQTISRILYYNDLYQLILGTPGVVCEFGVNWGSTVSLLASLRGIYEPYNYTRKIIGFDTFEGFIDISDNDGTTSSVGDFKTPDGHYDFLSKLLTLHETFSPISHIKKFELIKGDACQTFEDWLDENPASIISMAIFDLDLYKPTEAILQRITQRLTKGSLLVFDELSCPHFPGETMALMNTIGIGNLRLQRSPRQPWCAYAIWE